LQIARGTLPYGTVISSGFSFSRKALVQKKKGKEQQKDLGFAGEKA
jgi:hypothetical protein